MGLNYDDIDLPEKVSNILQHDFFMMEDVPAMMVKTVVNPVKFSAFTTIFLTKGSGDVDINLVNYHIEAPAILNISADHIVIPHNVSDDFTASFMVYSKRLVDSISTAIKSSGKFRFATFKPYIHLSEEDCQKYRKYYSEMKRIFQKSNQHFVYETLQFTTIAFFYDVAANYYDYLATIASDSAQGRITDMFIHLVQENFRKERFLDFYANLLEITPKHLSRVIKQHTGISAVEWINRHIILEAKVMLRSSNLNVQQISDELNFPSQSFFGRYFKKATGMTPKEYRASTVRN